MTAPRRRGVARGRVAALAVVSLVAAVAVAAVVVAVQRPWADEVQENDPLGLVGLWRVSDVDDPTAEEWLRLGGEYGVPGLELVRACGWSFGSWDAGRTVFVGAVEGASGACTSGIDPAGGFAPEWLREASSYAATADGWELRDSAGNPTATLTAETPPAAVVNALDDLGTDPAVTPDLRDALAIPGPLPVGLVPVTAEGLLGRWVPAGAPSTTDAHVTFGPQRWDGSDDCDTSGGRWALEDGGQLVQAMPVMTTAEWCEGGDATMSLMRRVARLGLDGDELVLVDAAGAELGRLVRP